MRPHLKATEFKQKFFFFTKYVLIFRVCLKNKIKSVMQSTFEIVLYFNIKLPKNNFILDLNPFEINSFLLFNHNNMISKSKKTSLKN